MVVRQRNKMISQSDPVIHPTVRKTFVKGVIAVALLSLFLDVRGSNLLDYGFFVLISIGVILFYMAEKRSSRYEIGEEGLMITSPLRACKIISYSEIEDISLSQGALAKRFNCGTVFIFLKGRRGGYMSIGGGAAEALRDVTDPKRVYDDIASRLAPY